jgi:hypothetical protein
MWSSRVAPIGADLLYAVDVDTTSDLVHYVVTRPTNGHLAFVADPTTSIYNFSQRDIDDGRLVFVRNTSKCCLNLDSYPEFDSNYIQNLEFYLSYL